MNQLLNKWRSITVVFLIISYLIIVVYRQQPLTTWLLIALGWSLLIIGLFFGTFIGAIGIFLQSITKKQEPSTPLYRLAYKLGTKNPTILASYGLLQLRANKPELSLECFNRALKNTHYFLTTKTLKCNKAIALWKLGRIDDAIELYLNVIDDYGKEKQKPIAEITYDQGFLEDLATDNDYLYPQDFTTLGFLYILQKNYVAAKFYTQAALLKKDDYASAYDNLGQIDYYQNHIDQAKEHFEKALSLNPTLPDSLYFQSRIAIKHQQFDLAKAYLERLTPCHLDGLNTITNEMVNEALKLLESSISGQS